MKLLPWLSLFLSSQEFFLEQVFGWYFDFAAIGAVVGATCGIWCAITIHLLDLPSKPTRSKTWLGTDSRNKDWSSNGRMRNKQQAHSNLAELDLIAPLLCVFFHVAFVSLPEKLFVHVLPKMHCLGMDGFCLGGKIK